MSVGSEPIKRAPRPHSIVARFCLLSSTCCANLRFLCRRRRLLFDNFDYLAGISLLVILEHEVLGLERIAFIVELDRTGDSFKVFDAPHGRGDLGPARPLAAVGFDPPFNRLDSY